MQIVSDVLQRPLRSLVGHQGSCLGAAWTAALGVGLSREWGGVSRFLRFDRVISPDPANADVYAEGYQTYRDLYARLSAKTGKAR